MVVSEAEGPQGEVGFVIQSVLLHIQDSADAKGSVMANVLSPDIDGINEAGKLVVDLIHTKYGWCLWDNPPKLRNPPEDLVRDVERLKVLLKKPDVGGFLSLANQYPIKIGNHVSVSYSQCVCNLFTSRLLGWNGPFGLPDDDLEVFYQCIKEVERATKAPYNAELIETAQLATQKYSRNPERDELIYQLKEQKKKLKDILAEVNEKYPEDRLDTIQGVREALVRRKKREKDNVQATKLNTTKHN